ncbi:MAG TPA: hypothetical protein VF831_06205 [Anaerolineales bacterium]
MPPIVKSFPKEGIIVYLPAYATTINVTLPTPPAITSMPAVPIGFHPFRVVANIKFVDTSSPTKTSFVFSEPVEIQVQYTDADFNIAKAARRDLSLGYWDGTRWLRYTYPTHQFQLVPATAPATGGLGIVKVLKWGDPPHAWGT